MAANEISRYGELARDKYREECEQLRRKGFIERPPPSGQVGLGLWEGTIRVPLDAEREPIRFTFRVAYPPGYPWAKPHCIPIDPLYRRRQHQQPDDLPPTEWPNRLCIWEDASGGWDPSFRLAEIVQAVESWVRATELAWNTRTPEEAAVFDLERYFGVHRKPIYVPNGLAPLVRPFGSLGLRECDACMLVASVDEKLCPGLDAAITGLGITDLSREREVPYIVCSQPRFPLFSNVGELLAELQHQGMDRKQLRKYLVAYSARGASTATAVLVFESLGRRVGCGLHFHLPSEVPGFRPHRAPVPFALVHARYSRLAASRLVSLDSDTLLRRNPIKMQHTDLRKAKIAVAGLGSVGSLVAEFLAKAGVDNIILIDAETLEAGNIVRHTVGLEGVGKAKAIAVRDRLRRFRVDANFEIPDCATNGTCLIERNIDALVPVLRDCDVFLDCTANEAVQDIFTREAVRLGRHYVRVQTYRAGRIGEVIVMSPGCPCPACIVNRIEGSHPRLAMSGLPGQETTIIAEGCACVTEPASAADLAATCALAAQAMIDLLLGSRLGWNVRFWIGRAIEDAPPDSIFARGPQVHESMISASGPCPLCQP